MYKCCFKRLFDFLIALLFLPFILLTIILIGPIIYFTDRGPIFYNANRAGKDGKTFKMYKLRSMYVNAPDLRNADGSTFNSDNDPRVTPIGRFIRKTSLDELPQLLNVLFGDMSFVGPRPTLANTKYEDYNEIRRKRSSIRPGITGYAQAYFRNSIGQEQKFEKDCFYVDHISLSMDIKILYETFISVIRHKNINTEQSKK